MLTEENSAELAREANRLTTAYPIGTPCRFWPGAREGVGRVSRIRSSYGVAYSGAIVVFVEGYSGYIAATHVEPIQEGELPIQDQPPPVPNAARPVWELVIEDMQARDHVGRQRYGTPLQAHNGRDALVDAYQEALDLCVYLRQAIVEREGKRGEQ